MKINRKNERGPFDIIGDVHGCLEELRELLYILGYREEKKSYIHPTGRKAIFLGDLGDRGPYCVESIRLVMGMIHGGYGLYVPGNHCNKLYRYLQGSNVQVKYGMEKTVAELKSLNPMERDIFSREFISFYEASPLYLILDAGNLVATHAGIKEEMIGQVNKRIKSFCLYGDTTGDVTPEGLPVRRDWAKHYRGKALIVYGHTPVEEPVFKNNTIDIDTACAMGGKLTALRYPERKIVQVPARTVYYIRDGTKIEVSIG
ncbi:metallophosphoesterase [Desulforamulus reducens MI-1]|uniref:Metallophosphoesterase n=1 Tax=Desulforamulus reducens (strain ATCC BAA-1160 / DSM 100696 / MI-1) TaxID=349161 RepID=A4J6J3_DESRM|nr:metallophosphoesterase [Desulforamulus reducens]ABO50696.1 metallophosphoesterase [Desulforamulus reducens MI-1]